MAGRKTMRHKEEWWELIAPPTAVRCEAHVQSGSRCLREAIPGANVCRQHGGAIPAVRAKAAARIGNAADAMVQRLHAMLDDPNVDARDKIKIAQDMLDRAGLNATEKLIVGVGPADAVETLFRDLLADPANNLVPSGYAQPSVSPPDPVQEALDRGDWDDIVDGEVVDTPESGARLLSPASLEVVSDQPPPHIREVLRNLI